MKELNPTYEQNSQIEEARLAVDAVYAEIGLKFPRDPINEELIQSKPTDIAQPVLEAEVLTNAGITEMKATDNHLDFARAMVVEARRDDIDSQFTLAA